MRKSYLVFLSLICGVLIISAPRSAAAYVYANHSGVPAVATDTTVLGEEPPQEVQGPVPPGTDISDETTPATPVTPAAPAPKKLAKPFFTTTSLAPETQPAAQAPVAPIELHKAPVVSEETKPAEQADAAVTVPPVEQLPVAPAPLADLVKPLADLIKLPSGYEEQPAEPKPAAVKPVAVAAPAAPVETAPVVPKVAVKPVETQNIAAVPAPVPAKPAAPVAIVMKPPAEVKPVVAPKPAAAAVVAPKPVAPVATVEVKPVKTTPAAPPVEAAAPETTNKTETASPPRSAANIDSVASALTPDETKPAVPTLADLTLDFDTTSTTLSPSVQKKLDGLAEQIKDADMRLQIRGYAKGDASDESSARRLALSRALLVRSYLMDKGIKAVRLDVRALGSETDKTPIDRVDLVFVR